MKRTLNKNNTHHTFQTHFLLILPAFLLIAFLTAHDLKTTTHQEIFLINKSISKEKDKNAHERWNEILSAKESKFRSTFDSN